MIAQVEPSAVTSEVHSLLDLEGMIQVFTAPHRSFFTNVVAGAIRTAAQGKSTLLIQFLKGGIGTGKDYPVKLCQHLTWIRCPLGQCIQSSEVSPEDRAEILALWDFAKSSVLSDAYSTVILDELNLAIELGLIPEADCLTLLAARPKRLDLILTGPNMLESILEMAHQVTELRRTLYV